MAPSRTLIPQDGGRQASDKCTSPRYVECRAAPERAPGERERQRCPYLSESMVQSCAAAEVTKYVPRTQALQSRCNGEGHRYCHLYLERVAPEPQGAQDDEGMAVDSRRDYASNHLWLDVADDGTLHVGVDALLAHVLGSVDSITFVAGRGPQRPTVIVRLGAHELPLVFPNRLPVQAVNVGLQADPCLLCRDPYGAGWLFEGYETPLATDATHERYRASLIRGAVAAAWMARERERLARFVHALLGARSPRGAAVMADGGLVARGLARQLGASELVQLFGAFFAPHHEWRS